MTLPALHARRLTASTSTMTAAAVLDALWAAVQPTVTTYVDGATRSFSGSGATGWTWSRVQVGGVTEALWASPPTGSLAQRFIIAARSATPTPTPVMLAPEGFGANIVYLAHAKNAGAFNAWNAAAPFTSGDFSGYWRIGPAVTTLTAPLVWSVYETEETIDIVYGVGTAGAVYGAGAGAMVDPESSDAADAESDGRIYGMWTGGNPALASMLAAAGNFAQYLIHSTSINFGHFMLWRPGTSTIDTANRTTSWAGITTANTTTRGGKFPGQPIWVTTAVAWGGRVRNRYVIRPGLCNQKLVDGTTSEGYALAQNTTTTGDTVLMEY